MSEKKHTPGPWGGTQPFNGLMPDDMIGIGVTGQNLALVELRHGMDEGLANARLIAAAPELLAAAEANVNGGSRCTRRDCGKCSVCLSRAAIAKAKGGK